MVISNRNKSCICGNPHELLGDLKLKILGNKKSFRKTFVQASTSFSSPIRIIYFFPFRKIKYSFAASKNTYYSIELSRTFQWDKLYQRDMLLICINFLHFTHLVKSRFSRKLIKRALWNTQNFQK